MNYFKISVGFLVLFFVLAITFIFYKSMPFYISSYGTSNFSLVDTDSYQILKENYYFDQMSIDNNLSDYDSSCHDYGTENPDYLQNLYFEKNLKKPTFTLVDDSGKHINGNLTQSDSTYTIHSNEKPAYIIISFEFDTSSILIPTRDVKCNI